MNGGAGLVRRRSRVTGFGTAGASLDRSKVIMQLALAVEPAAAGSVLGAVSRLGCADDFLIWKVVLDLMSMSIELAADQVKSLLGKARRKACSIICATSTCL